MLKTLDILIGATTVLLLFSMAVAVIWSRVSAGDGVAPQSRPGRIAASRNLF